MLGHPHGMDGVQPNELARMHIWQSSSTVQQTTLSGQKTGYQGVSGECAVKSDYCYILHYCVVLLVSCSYSIQLMHRNTECRVWKPSWNRSQSPHSIPSKRGSETRGGS